jgi:dipeptidyl aminopeptidase/acylaminoacyl peptidase
MSRTLIAVLSLVSLGAAQTPYKTPPKAVVELLDAPTTPTPRPSPDAQWMLLVERPAMPSIADVARPWIGLAGSRVDPATNAPVQANFDTGLVLRDLGGASERRIELPKGAKLSGLSWSHDSRHFAFLVHEDEDVELWAGDVDSANAKRVTEHVNALFGAFDWMPDGRRMLVTLIPAGRAKAPAEPKAPAGPTVMESSGKRSPLRTYQDLLQNDHDAALFEHFGTSQLALVDPADGSVKPFGAPGLIKRFDPAPGGEYVLVARMQRPFSFLLTSERFPTRTEVWRLDGSLAHLVHQAPLEDQIPIEGVPLGPRSVSWRPLQPATLVWAEALDGGDPKTKVPARDRWMSLAAPFEGAAEELVRTEHRARGLTWFVDPRYALVSDYDRDRRWTRSTLHDLAAKSVVAVLEDRSVNDRYGDLGAISMSVESDGSRVVRQSGEWIFRTGEGATDTGARPFLDRQSLATRAIERLWRCDESSYESVAAFVSVDSSGLPTVLTRRETPVEPPNLHLRDLAANSAKRITNFTDPQPQIRGIKKELVKYQRDDGVQLSATLYVPANYEKGERLPMFVWAYPLEYNDPATAGQVSGSTQRFTTIRGASHLALLTQGYCVLDNATMPIVGDPETMNDTFVAQISAAARAAIEKANELGVADPSRVAVGGHSYGAFMTANLLAHTDLFRAGCARSGAYNRTLTPFGFQSERRSLWEAPQIYSAVSPFMHADKINEPLLLIHGEKDSNPGTFPMQSERLYQAVAGHGGTVRLCMLPEENHGYSARESILHAQAEMIEWLDTHVKNARTVEAAAPRAVR